ASAHRRLIVRDWKGAALKDKALEIARRLARRPEDVEWLAAGLSLAADGIDSAIKAKTGHPPREALRNRLIELQRAAALVVAELEEATMWAQGVPAGSADRGESLGGGAGARSLLHGVIPRAKRAAVTIPRHKGSDKHFPDSTGLSPHEVCAVWV